MQILVEMNRGKTKPIIKKRDYIILQYNFAGYLVNHYDNIKVAAGDANMAVQSIWRSCNINNEQAGGYFWKKITKSELEGVINNKKPIKLWQKTKTYL